jgi:4-amino-4-deoxy-L-arabinose transferase-like glycosyltransferase
MTSRTEKILLAILFAIAFSVRVAYHHETLSLPPQQPDGYYYHRLAENVLRGRGYSILWPTGHRYDLFRPPGYPLFLAGIYSVIGPDYAAVKLIQMALSAATVLILFFLAFRICGRKGAWIAAFIAAFYWRSALWSGIYRAETLFMFFLLLSLYFLVADSRQGRSAPTAASAVFLGISYLIRPNVIGIVPWLALWLWTNRAQHVLRRTGATALFIGVFVATIAPWPLYNYFSKRVTPADSIATTMGAVNMWMAQTPSMGDEVDNRGFEKVNALRYENYSLDESGWIDLLKKQTKRFVTEAPLHNSKMALLRFKKHWLAAGVMDGEGTIYADTGKNRYGILYFFEGFWKPETYVRDDVWVSMEFKKRLVAGGIWVPLLTFEGVFDVLVFGFIAALIFARGRISRLLAAVWRKSSILIIFTAGYSLFSMIGHAHHRLRFPIEWIAIVYAGWGIGNVVDLVTRRGSGKEERRLPPPSHCPLILILTVLVALSFLATIRHAIARHSRQVRAVCAEPSQEKEAGAFFAASAPDAYARRNETVGFRDVWRYQMEHLGDIGSYRGTVVLWTGETTYVRELSLEELKDEPPPYREAWKIAGPHDKHPLFIRFVVGAYDDPSTLGEGEALVICDKLAAGDLQNGDRVSILAEISGTDASGMGYVIAFGRAIYRWERATGNR